jgi:excisionase family DNA binding protein
VAAVESALEQMIADAVEARIAPLRAELERLRAANDSGPVLPAEAARRLGITVRDVHRRLRDGRLEAVHVGGVRLVRWPPSPGPR